MQHQHTQPDLTRTKEQATEKKSQGSHSPSMCNQKSEKHMQLQSNHKNPFLSPFLLPSDPGVAQKANQITA